MRACRPALRAELKSKLDAAERDATMARLTAVTDLAAASDGGLAIEGDRALALRYAAIFELPAKLA